jgi:hypothetical protein
MSLSLRNMEFALSAAAEYSLLAFFFVERFSIDLFA